MGIKEGDKLRIIRMMDEPQYDGKEGYVTLIDGIGQIHGTWGGCALVKGDRFEVIESSKLTFSSRATSISERR